MAARLGWDAGVGGDDAGEVEGVDSSKPKSLVGSLIAACAAEGVDSIGEGELFAGEAGDEATATNIAAGFEAS